MTSVSGFTRAVDRNYSVFILYNGCNSIGVLDVFIPSRIRYAVVLPASNGHYVLIEMITGGHVGMIFGWLIPSLFVLTVAASMAELASSMP